MAELKQDFSLFAGELLTVKFTLKDNTRFGSPALNLAPFSIDWAASKITSSCSLAGSAVIDKCSNLGEIRKVNSLQGILEFDLTLIDTSELAGPYSHQLSIVDSLGNRIIVAQGTMVINKRIPTTC